MEFTENMAVISMAEYVELKRIRDAAIGGLQVYCDYGWRNGGSYGISLESGGEIVPAFVIIEDLVKERANMLAKINRLNNEMKVKDIKIHNLRLLKSELNSHVKRLTENFKRLKDEYEKNIEIVTLDTLDGIRLWDFMKYKLRKLIKK